jgi:predicted nucleic acid-binding protein
MGTRKVVVDTNVVVSALLFGGTPGKLIDLWQMGAIKPMASKQNFLSPATNTCLP